MGSPETTIQPKPVKKNESPATIHPLRPLEIAEKLDLLHFAQQRGSLSINHLGPTLDRVRDMLQSMVRYVDKPLKDLRAFCEIPPSLEKKRGMIVFNDFGHATFMSVALNRQGEWVVQPFKPALGKILIVDSYKLATMLTAQFDALIERAWHYQAFGKWKEVSGNLKSLQYLLRYAAAVGFVKTCYETVEQSLREQEERMSIMRTRLDFGKDFSAALDPLLAKRETLRFPGYAIWSDSAPGKSSRDTGTYFSREALAPFFELTGERPKEYHEKEEPRTMRSLEELTGFVGNIFSETSDMESARSIFGRTRGRLPLTLGEIEVLEQCASAVL